MKNIILVILLLVSYISSSLQAQNIETNGALDIERLVKKDFCDYHEYINNQIESYHTNIYDSLYSTVKRMSYLYNCKGIKSDTKYLENLLNTLEIDTINLQNIVLVLYTKGSPFAESDFDGTGYYLFYQKNDSTYVYPYWGFDFQLKNWKYCTRLINKVEMNNFLLTLKFRNNLNTRTSYNRYISNYEYGAYEVDTLYDGNNAKQWIKYGKNIPYISYHYYLAIYKFTEKEIKNVERYFNVILYREEFPQFFDNYKERVQKKYTLPEKYKYLFDKE